MTRRPYVPRPYYSGIGRLRLALARGAYIAEAIVGRRETKVLVGAGYQPRKRTIRLAMQLGDIVPAGDGLLPDMPQTWRLADGRKEAA